LINRRASPYWIYGEFAEKPKGKQKEKKYMHQGNPWIPHPCSNSNARETDMTSMYGSTEYFEQFSMDLIQSPIDCTQDDLLA
jgi:hypothetical protein